jgi:hypothetical protein
VLRDHQILVCPGCQTLRDWTEELDRCGRCASAHLVRRLDEVECRDCGLIRLTGVDGDPGADHVCTVPGHGASGVTGAEVPAVPAAREARMPASPDPELAAEVERALAKVLGKTAKIVAAP